MKIEKIINKLKMFLISNNIKYPFSLVGSSVKYDKYNDIDFLMIVDNIEKTRESIKALFKDYRICICDDAIRIDDFAQTTISIALYTKEKIGLLVDSYNNGDKIELTHRTWCTGYWLPESLIANLQNMIIIHDVDCYLEKLKNKILKKSVYFNKMVIKECIEEINNKYAIMKNKPFTSIEYSLLKNDIILCIIRGIKIIKGELLISFKKIDETIKDLNCKELNEFIDNDSKGINEIIKIFHSYDDWSNRLYFGTWQLSGDFKPLTNKEIIDLIKYAKFKGFVKFDTALVYGNGKVEKILGKYLDDNCIIVTKVPAKIKPPKECNEELSNYYDYKYIENCIKKSYNNLNKKIIDVCLLHNWTLSWNNNQDIINYLKKIKDNKLAKKVGISLPNGFENELSDEVLSVIDVIEAPYNSENKWILNSIKKYKSYGIEIILRSLFLQGREKDRNNYKKILENVKELNTSIVIGMTTKEQIDENKKVMDES